MRELLIKLKEKEEIRRICRENYLNYTLLKNLFLLSTKGYNNTDIAQKLGIHKVTVQRYSQTLKSMNYEEYVRLFNYVINDMEQI